MTATSFETALRDGTPVRVRHVQASDAHLVEIGFERLSDRSRYLRFFHPVTRLSEHELRRLTEIDQYDHLAWGALDLTHEEADPIGVSRYIRLQDDPSVAELALAVVDSHQGRGLGKILLAAAAYAASRNGIAAFEASVLADNRAMLKLFGELGAGRRPSEPGVYEIRVPVHEDAGAYPDTATRASFERVYGLLGA